MAFSIAIRTFFLFSLCLRLLGFPYHVDPDDHCESPLDAYQDIAPLLQSIIIREPALDLSRHAKQSTPTSNDNSNETPTSTNHKNHGSAADKNKNNGNPLRIYDPYYCDGAVIQNLTQLGLPNVYNRKEDCYSVWKNSTESLIPPFDVLVTNPPYSEDHIERLFRFLTSPTFGHRRWFVLLPTWVHKKDFYTNATNRIAPFYLIPHRRYVYLPPPNFRESKKSSVHRKSSPFVSMWYCWGGTTEGNNQLMQQFYHYNKTLKSKSQCDLARSKSALRDLRRKPRK